jgi:hypothetical protein
MDTTSVCETIRQYIIISAEESVGYYELRKYKTWFDEERSKLLDQIAVVTASKRIA